MQHKLDDQSHPKQQPDTNTKPFLVQGQVRQNDGTPLTRVIVQAYDRDLRSRQFLHQCHTDKIGHYEIRYSAEQFQRAEKGTADLVLLVVNPNDEKDVLLESPTFFNAPIVATIDLVVDRYANKNLSEYERMVNDLQDVLEGVALADLTKDDISFLTNETGISEQYLTFLMLSARLGQQTELPPEAFYGLARENLPTDLPALLALSYNMLRQALEAAFKDNIIPARLSDELDEILERLQQLSVKYALQDPQKQEKTPLGALLDVALPSADLQKSFVSLSLQHDGPPEDFWKQLRGQPEFQGAGVVDDLQLTLQMGVLTLNNAALIQAVRQNGQIHAMPDLAMLDVADWEALIRKTGDDAIPDAVHGSTPDEKVKNYANSIVTLLKGAFPTIFVCKGLVQAPAIDLALVRQVRQRNPQLDVSAPLPANLDWGSMSADDRARATASLDALRQEIKMFPALQRQPGFSPNEQLNATGGFQNPIRQGVTQFLTNAADFDLRSTNIDTYVAEHADQSFAGINAADHQVVLDSLKAIQRVARVAPRYEQVAALMGAGLHSAHDIADASPETFTAQYRDTLGGETAAQMVYANAERVRDMTTLIYMNVRQTVHDNPLRVMNHSGPVLDPTLTSLFGNQDFCDCEDCRSVYSPAAYFVDLLHFLDPKVWHASAPKPLDVLLQHRPDLQYIQLTCENTNTLTPYVDLVNEILESYIHHNGAAAFNQWDPASHTSLPQPTADELSVHPVYLTSDSKQSHDVASNKISQAVYPLSLPYNRPLEVMRTYLDFIGSSRYEVMQTFQRNNAPSDSAIAYEYLKLSKKESEILLDIHSSPQRYYGYDGTSSTWMDDLKKVPVFLAHTGISYTDLIELLKTRFLNPVQAATLQAGTDACDLSQTTIANWDEHFLSRAHRFIRLWRKLGWTIAEVDKALTALPTTANTPEIDDPFLGKLAAVCRLQMDLNLPVVTLLSLWSSIDTWGEDSLYQQLFRNKTVYSPLDDAFVLNPDGSSTQHATLSNKASIIAAALRISAANLAALQRALNLPDSTPLNQDNLSLLSRYVILARGLRLPIADILAFYQLLGMDPFKSPASGQPPQPDPHQTVRFIQRVRQVRQSPFSLAQLNYLYRHITPVSPGVALQQAQLLQFIRTMRVGFQKIAQDMALAPDPNGDLLRQRLTAVLDSSLVDTAIDVINNTPPPNLLSPDPHTASSDDQTKKRQFIQQYFASFVPVDEATTTLLAPLGASPEDQQQANRLYMLTHLLAYLQATASRSLVKQFVRDTLKLDGAVMELLVENLLSSRITPSQQHIIDDLLAGGQGGLVGTYFTDTTLTTVATTRIDPALQFQWQRGSTDAAVRLGNFGVRWTGWLLTDRSEQYTLRVDANDGVRLWLDDQLLIDAWTAQPTTEHQALVTLQMGKLYQLRLEYYTTSMDATVALSWESPSTQKAIIPQGHLCPDAVVTGYTLLYKAAMLINGFKIKGPKLAYLSAHRAQFAGFNLDTLPLKNDPDASSGALLDQWERLYKLFMLRDGLPQGDKGLFDVLSAPSLAEARKRLETITSWEKAQVEDITSGWSQTDYQTEIALCWLQACMAFSGRLGVAATKLLDWATHEPGEANAQEQEVQNTIKARYDADQWVTIAKPLNDTLRESWKEALIAYILANPTPQLKAKNVTNSNGLFEYFLVDVDMTTCRMTSRIQLAISSVQLFIQRCLMNLERHPTDATLDVSPSALRTRWWQWMKSYSLWAANRQLFIYPENYLRPELRDDKSSFFKDLQNELQQRDVQADKVETAFLHYLEKLDRVSRLEICGMYWEKEPTSTWEDSTVPADEQADILHVFGRTTSTPHSYYYRRLLNRRTWTPWEKVQVEIEGDHLIPVVYNRRLYLYWPMFSEFSDPNQPIANPDQGTSRPIVAHSSNPDQSTTGQVQPRQGNPAQSATGPAEAQKKREIQLAYSEYRSGVWSAKQIVVTPGPQYCCMTGAGLQPLDQHFLTTRLDQDHNLVVEVHCPTTSFALLFNGCDGAVTSTSIQAPGTQLFPVYYRHDFMSLARGRNTGRYSSLTLTTTAVDVYPLLEQTPDTYPFHIPYPQQNPGILQDMPFFYQDDARTYFVTPEELVSVLLVPLTQPDKLKVTGILKKSTIQQKVGIAGKQEYVLAGEKLPGLTQANQGAGDQLIQATLQHQSISSTDVTVGRDIASTANAVTISDRSPRWRNTNTSWVDPEAQYGLFVDIPAFTQEIIRSDVWHFHTHFHPQVCAFIRQLNRLGIPGLLTLPNQQLTNDQPTETVFYRQYLGYYATTVSVHPDYPREDVDFQTGAFALYNWETFFHAPMLIATRLSSNQQFEEAQRWFHYIFDPTSDSTDPSPQRYWKLLPFYNNSGATTDQISTLLELLSYAGSNSSILERKQQVVNQVEEWRDNPFNPHLIARLRITAYQKYVVMRYIDNLIAWGDYLFNQNTLESINQATLLYVLAANILGPRPERIPPRGTVETETYASLRSHWSDFSDALVGLETVFPFSDGAAVPSSGGSGVTSISSAGQTLYFCVPPNDTLLKYWKTVDQRLDNIRHCMNIQGVVEQPPLFESPANLQSLLQTGLTGADLSSALNDSSVGLPQYRFTVLAQKATELCAEVKSLGALLLAALEKGDAEGLALLRSTHEINLLTAIQQVKKRQIQEAQETLEGLRRYRLVVAERHTFYQTIERISSSEQLHMNKLGEANIYQVIGQGLRALAAILHQGPTIKTGVSGWAGTPVAIVSWGGPNLGDSMTAMSEVSSILATLATYDGTMASFNGANERRWNDWKLQERLAQKELDQIDQQINAAVSRVTIATMELSNHLQQIANAQEVDSYMRSKFTNEDLYVTAQVR